MSREGDANHGTPTPQAIRRAPGFLARRLHQAYAAAWVRQVDSTLTGPQYAVLTSISEHPNLDQGTLAISVSLDRSTMADVCRRLEERGLIQRVTAPSDGRRKLLGLTAVGARTLDDVRSRVEDLEQRLLARSENELRLLDELAALAEDWEGIADGPRPLSG